ncbi:hypothetical protein [Bacillus sp. SRB_8]|uniref:hypothetical protein n=1 Tax=Bacillus sp. SRB_8 TaxID=1969377 RepID=UPI000DC2FD44|nr:hypothetical protein [Bacillus sp. SRB_8]RAN66233.1 hypothetical protein B5P40_32115 [Bacillus sp. SRB_8]
MMPCRIQANARQELPPDRKVIACKWVFDTKPNLVGDGGIRKFKARLVIKSFSQRAGEKLSLPSHIRNHFVSSWH